MACRSCHGVRISEEERQVSEEEVRAGVVHERERARERERKERGVIRNVKVYVRVRVCAACVGVSVREKERVFGGQRVPPTDW